MGFNSVCFSPPLPNRKPGSDPEENRQQQSVRQRVLDVRLYKEVVVNNSRNTSQINQPMYPLPTRAAEAGNPLSG
jgi:hypothetical protein